MNRDPYAVVGAARRASLELAIAHVEAFYGAAWFHNPQRWRTDDGVVPFRQFWASYHAMTAILAFRRLQDARAFTHALRRGDDRQQSEHAELAEAFPELLPADGGA